MSAQDYLDEYKEDKGTDMSAQEVVDMAARKRVVIRRPSGVNRAVRSVSRAGSVVGRVGGRIFSNVGSSIGKTVDAVTRQPKHSGKHSYKQSYKQNNSSYSPFGFGFSGYGGGYGDEERRYNKRSRKVSGDYVVVHGKKYYLKSRYKKHKRKFKIHRDRPRDYNSSWNPLTGGW